MPKEILKQNCFALTVPVETKEEKTYLHNYASLLPSILVIESADDRKSIYIEVRNLQDLTRFIEHYKKFMDILVN